MLETHHEKKAVFNGKPNPAYSSTKTMSRNMIADCPFNRNCLGQFREMCRTFPNDAHSDVSSGARSRCLKFDLNFQLHLNFEYASSECSGESAHLRRLIRAFVAKQ